MIFLISRILCLERKEEDATRIDFIINNAKPFNCETLTPLMTMKIIGNF